MNPSSIPAGNNNALPNENTLNRKLDDPLVAGAVAQPVVSHSGRQPTAVAETQAAEASQTDGIQSTNGNPAVDGPVSPTTAGLEAEGLFGTFEVDDDVVERDSAYGDEVESITTSIAESVQNFKYEHGRRYHAYQEGKYALPNDDEEIMRLELQHRIWTLSLSSRLGLSPLPNPLRNVLDIGCGTGAWAIDFAEAHPNTRVIGTDLSPIQPSVVPPNVEFIIDDITAPWIFDHQFDYIHSRAITIGVRDWEKLVDEVWCNLAPGGWVEFQEYHAPFVSDDDTIKRCPSFEKWNMEILGAARKAGTKLDAILQVPGVLERQGFSHLGTASTKWPVGPWAKGKREKQIGDLCLRDLTSALEGLSMRMFTRVLGWSREEVTELIEQVAREMHSGKMHAYLPIDFLWAQKPIVATDEHL